MWWKIVESVKRVQAAGTVASWTAVEADTRNPIIIWNYRNVSIRVKGWFIIPVGVEQWSLVADAVANRGMAISDANALHEAFAVVLSEEVDNRQTCCHQLRRFHRWRQGPLILVAKYIACNLINQVSGEWIEQITIWSM